MNHALFVGINRYLPSYYGSGNDLEQCVNDSGRMADWFGRNVKDWSKILQMTDEWATAENFISELSRLASITQKGDVVFISQSSHGTTYQGSKGVASGLCFYDRIMWDDEVHLALRQFKAGVTVVRITDACFSESSHRSGFNKPRIARFMPCPNHTFPERLRAKTKKGQPTALDNRKIRCQIFNYSACLFDQVAWEDENGGAWTTALLSGLAKHPDNSYLGVFKDAGPTPSQSPVFEVVRASKRVNDPFLSPIKVNPK